MTALHVAPVHDAVPDAVAVPGNADQSELSRDDAASLLDEDTLRDMVSDIVREELQGALGERITRNVRKLVRREIQRALTAQDLNKADLPATDD